MQERLRRLARSSNLQLAAAFVVGCGVFANTLLNGFASDDEQLVLLNPWITDIRFLPEIFSSNAWGFLGSTGSSNYYRPLLHVLYLGVHHVFGFHAWAFHLLNVLLHGGNTILVLLLTRRLLGRAQRLPPAQTSLTSHTGALPVALIAALLFAAHPIHTEAVAWISGVQELSFTLLVLLSFYLYAGDGCAGDGAAHRRAAKRAVSVGCFFLALLCKETALTLPAMLLVYDLAFGGFSHRGSSGAAPAAAAEETRRPSRRRALQQQAKRQARSPASPAIAALYRYVPYLLAVALYAVLRHLALSAAVPVAGLNKLGLGVMILSIPPLFAQHLGKLLLPVGLNFRHAFHPVSSLLTLDAVQGLAVAATFVAVSVVAWKKDRLTLLCLAWIVVPLVPTFYINALAVKPFAERFAYLPSFGFVVLAALVMSAIASAPRLKAASAALAAVTVVLYANGAIARNRVWKDSYTLYTDTASRTPDSPTPPYELAVALLRAGWVEEAIAQLRILVAVHGDDARYRSTLGSAFLARGSVPEAIVQLQAALALAPDSRETLNDLAIALRRSGRAQEAIGHYESALALDPDYAEAHFNLAGVLADTGQPGKAIEHYRAAVRSAPGNAYYRNVLGIELGKLASYREAVEQFEEAVRLAPAEPAYRRNLERALSLEREAAARAAPH